MMRAFLIFIASRLFSPPRCLRAADVASFEEKYDARYMRARYHDVMRRR